MKDILELDPRILQKNLEITKLSRQVDSLKTQLIDLAEDKSQPNLLAQENMDLKAQISRLKDVIRQLSDPLRR